MTLVVILFIFHTFGKKATRFLHVYLYVCVWNEREKLLLQNYRGTLCRTNKNKKVSIFRGEKNLKSIAFQFCVFQLAHIIAVTSVCVYHSLREQNWREIHLKITHTPSKQAVSALPISLRTCSPSSSFFQFISKFALFAK